MFCEAVAIYGIIMAILMRQKWERVHDMYPNAKDYQAGYILFAAGFGAGLCNIFSGCVNVFLFSGYLAGSYICFSIRFSLCVGVAGSSAALGDAQNPKLFVRLIVVEIFGSALGLFGIIVGIVGITGLQFGSLTPTM